MSEVRRRVRGSGPILILAGLFVTATLMAWYVAWFGRELSDADISKYLADENNPRHVQHGLTQVQARMERGDGSAKQWYTQLITLSGNSETEFRLTVAWLMGFDNSAPEFHEALLKLVHDEQPLVRRNAALALVRFNDNSGHEELISILKPYVLKAPVDGVVASSMLEGATVTRRTPLARIEQGDGKVIVLRSPLLGRVNQIFKQNGSQVTHDEDLVSLNSDEQSIWEALRGLAIIGTSDDLPVIESYASAANTSARVKEQASLTAKVIRQKSV